MSVKFWQILEERVKQQESHKKKQFSLPSAANMYYSQRQRHVSRVVLHKHGSQRGHQVKGRHLWADLSENNPQLWLIKTP